MALFDTTMRDGRFLRVLEVKEDVVSTSDRLRSLVQPQSYLAHVAPKVTAVDTAPHRQSSRNTIESESSFRGSVGKVDAHSNPRPG